MATSRINLFEYKDYRAFLKDWYKHEKHSRRSFSYRTFAKKAGFKTSNFMMLVMKGKRNLTEASLTKMIKGLDLNKQEQEFFRSLVFFNQAKTHKDKNYYYQRLSQSKKFRLLKSIEKKEYEYYSKWYYPVVRELVVSKNFDGTPEWLCQRIRPTISSQQAKKSIQLLESLEFIKKIGPNKWKQMNTILSTGPALKSVVVHNYHKTLLNLTLDVMDRLTMEHRDVSAMTLGIKRENLGELRSKIRQFRQEILKMVSTDTEPEEVVQLQIQFFPVTQNDNTPKK